jgi:hypothetical protein
LSLCAPLRNRLAADGTWGCVLVGFSLALHVCGAGGGRGASQGGGDHGQRSPGEGVQRGWRQARGGITLAPTGHPQDEDSRDGGRGARSESVTESAVSNKNIPEPGGLKCFSFINIR